jgi:large subunit ribosomal protein L6
MSKIGKKPISLPQGVEVKIEKNKIFIKGPRGSLDLKVKDDVTVEIGEKELVVKKVRNTNQAQAFWGLYRSLIASMVQGVTEGYSKQLELQGVGFRMSIQGKKIDLALGFSHPVQIEIPEGLEAKLEENNILTISGIDKQKVGQFAANIKKLKPVEPYKGKGFRYVGEQVRRKVGKKAAAVA